MAADVPGLPVIAEFGPLAFVDLGGVRLLLQGGAPGRSVLYFAVDDIRAARSPLEG